MIEKDYLDLIPSANRLQPDFIKVVQTDLAVPLRVQELLAAMVPLFDVDTAIGKQLDIIGQWVGISRNVLIPVANIYFSWDSTADVGWDFGSWEPAIPPTAITTLPDDAYRTLIRAKIAANQWIGTTEGAYKIWESVFPNTTILIQDHQDMSYALAVVGGTIDTLTLALLLGGYIPLKPEGVLVSAYYVSVDSNPVFGWDVESDFLGGWEEASWVRELSPT